MMRAVQFHKNRRGISMIEIMVVMVLISIIMSGMFFMFNRTNRQLRSQSMVADIQTVGSIAFFLIGRDIRRAGSNPSGALGYSVGVPIPFALAEYQRIEVLADLNGDGDASDADEDVLYEYIDNDADITGNDTIRRTAGTSVTYISNVYDFRLNYIMSNGVYSYINGVYTTDPTPLSDIRMVVIHFEVGTDQRDPNTNRIITRTFETTVSLRNYQ